MTKIFFNDWEMFSAERKAMINLLLSENGIERATIDEVREARPSELLSDADNNKIEPPLSELIRRPRQHEYYTERPSTTPKEYGTAMIGKKRGKKKRKC